MFSELLKTFLHNSRPSPANYVTSPITLPQIQDRISQETLKIFQNHLKLFPTQADIENIFLSVCFSFDVFLKFSFLTRLIFSVFFYPSAFSSVLLNFLLSSTNLNSKFYFLQDSVQNSSTQNCTAKDSYFFTLFHQKEE